MASFKTVHLYHLLLSPQLQCDAAFLTRSESCHPAILLGWAVYSWKGTCNSLWSLLSLRGRGLLQMAWPKSPEAALPTLQLGAFGMETSPLRAPGHKQMDASNQVVLAFPPSLNKRLWQSLLEKSLNKQEALPQLIAEARRCRKRSRLARDAGGSMPPLR